MQRGLQHGRVSTGGTVRRLVLPGRNALALVAMPRQGLLPSFRPVPVCFRADQDDGENGRRPVGRRGCCVKRRASLPDISARDVGDRPSTEPGEDLLGVVTPLDHECPRLPVPRLPPKDLFGDDLEQGPVRRNRSTASGCGKHRPRPLAGIVNVHAGGIADSLSGPHSSAPGVKEVVLAPPWGRRGRRNL